MAISSHSSLITMGRLPIVDNPNAAVFSEEARSTVRALAARYPTAIVSGRARATAQGLVQLDELYYAGSHGFDITGPIRKRRTESLDSQSTNNTGEDVALPTLSYQVADSFRPALEEAKGLVEEGIRGIQGAMVEDDTFSVSVHYRMVAEGEDRERVNAATLTKRFPPCSLTTHSLSCDTVLEVVDQVLRYANADAQR